MTGLSLARLSLWNVTAKKRPSYRHTQGNPPCNPHCHPQSCPVEWIHNLLSSMASPLAAPSGGTATTEPIGAGLNALGAWSGPTEVGSGWQNFKGVFGMGDGIIYAIAGDGKLKWYKHIGFRDGTMAWEGPKDVGTGWQNFKQVFGAGNGVILYAIAGNGILIGKNTPAIETDLQWEGPKNVGTGWRRTSKKSSAWGTASSTPLPATGS